MSDEIERSLARLEVKVADLAREFESHDVRMTGVGENLNRTMDKLADVAAKISDAVTRLSVIEEQRQKNGNGSKSAPAPQSDLIKWLVLAVILASIGSEGLRLVASALGLK